MSLLTTMNSSQSNAYLAAMNPGYDAGKIANLNQHYNSVTGRNISQGELDFWMPRYDTTNWSDIDQVIAAFEYQSTTPGMTQYYNFASTVNLPGITGPGTPPTFGTMSAPGTLPGLATGLLTNLAGTLVGQLGTYLTGKIGPGTKSLPTMPGAPTLSSPTTTSLFSNACPPGKVLRIKPGLARNICIKKPRMNVFNPRALARADRRVTSFARRSKAILQDMGFHVSPRHKSLAKKKRRR